jgi:precorrin-3B synthase
VTEAATFEVKGWCPTALRPMQSGDGLIVRVRPRCGMFSLRELVVLADAALRHGNGHIDLTRRANLQIRGVSETSLQELQDVISALGLLDSTAEGEAARNLMVSPLAGIDPAEMLDVREIARELARQLASDPVVRVLPPKFGFVIDGGGALGLADERADIRVTAIRGGAEPAMAIGIDTTSGTDWLGSASVAAAADVAIETARAFVKVMPDGTPKRMREVSDAHRASIRSIMIAKLNPPKPASVGVPEPAPRVGLLDFGSNRLALGLAAPFGRVEAAQLRNFAEAIAAFGVEEVRLSPWRILYVEAVNRSLGDAILNAARSTGFIVDALDPLLRIEACPGAPACQSTELDTRSHARQLAGLLTQLDFGGNVHVSGCAKGCARSEAADLTLVGAGGNYGIVHNGTARDRPVRRYSFSDLAADPGVIFGWTREAS